MKKLKTKRKAILPFLSTKGGTSFRAGRVAVCGSAGGEKQVVLKEPVAGPLS